MRNRAVLAGVLAAVFVSILLLSAACAQAYAQTNVAFTPADQFRLPDNNATVRFGANGTYQEATVDNGVWNFVNLQLNHSRPQNLQVSAQDSNITIFAYSRLNFTNAGGTFVFYVVEGKGEQSFKFDSASSSVEWSVLFNQDFKAEGDGWRLSPDGTLTVTGATANVTLLSFNFSGPLQSDANLPFYLQHSVAIATAVAVAVTFALALVIRAKNKSGSEMVARGNSQ